MQVATFYSKYYLKREKVSKRKEHSGIKLSRCCLPRHSSEFRPGFSLKIHMHIFIPREPVNQ